MAKKDFMSLMKEKTLDVRPSLLLTEENIKRQLVILDHLRDLIPPLTHDEQAQLTQNILKHGIKDPLTVWETTADLAGLGEGDTPVYVLIDGHNRYQISQVHQLDFRISLVRFDSLDEVKDFMIAYQLGRRNLTPEQTSYFRGLRYNQQKTRRGSNLHHTGPQVNVADVLANEYGVSSRTIKRDGEFASNLEQLDADTKQMVLTGKQPRSVVQVVKRGKLGTAPKTNDRRVKRGSVNENEILIEHETLVRSQIRQLATSDLTYQVCTELIQKINELLPLLETK